MMYWIDRNSCTACLECIDACDVAGALIVYRNKPVIDAGHCTECGNCIAVCEPIAIVALEPPVVAKNDIVVNAETGIERGVSEARDAVEVVDATELLPSAEVERRNLFALVTRGVALELLRSLSAPG